MTPFKKPVKSIENPDNLMKVAFMSILSLFSQLIE